MRTNERAYIAGFFDGEGHVTIFRKKDGRIPKGYTETIKVGISQIDRRPLDLIKDRFGGSVFRHTSGVHELGFTSLPAIRRFLSAVLPYLIVKREAALAGIAYCDTRLRARAAREQQAKAVRALRHADPKAWTQDKLARRYGISRRRVRQILAHAMEDAQDA